MCVTCLSRYPLMKTAYIAWTCIQESCLDSPHFTCANTSALPLPQNTGSSEDFAHEHPQTTHVMCQFLVAIASPTHSDEDILDFRYTYEILC